MNADYSRTLLLAQKTSGAHSGLEERLGRAVVRVSYDDSRQFPALRVLIGNLRRLPVRIHLDPVGTVDDLGAARFVELQATADGIDRDRPIEISIPTRNDLHLHLGVHAVDATVSATTDGHGVRLRRSPHTYPALHPGSGLGHVVTAAFLTAEAFKTLVDARPQRHAIRTAIDFCPVTLGEPAAPALVPQLAGATLLGGGAIGTGIALIMRELEVEGDLTVVDPETFDAPNVATYSLGAQDDALARHRKVDLIRRELTNVNVTPVFGTAQDYIVAIDAGEYSMPEIVLGAVDSIEARHQIAKIHAALTLDGSTGGGSGTTIGLAEARWTGPCLRCFYPILPAPGPDPLIVLAEATGLRLDVLRHGDRDLTVEDLARLTPEQQTALNAHVGRPICGLAHALDLLGHDDSYRPSAAFVSQQAAALVVGAWIARSAGNLNDFRDIEYDALFGPNADMALVRAARPDCQCQRDIDLIDTIRAQRIGAGA